MGRGDRKKIRWASDRQRKKKAGERRKAQERHTERTAKK
jgi:hypothetical protein